MTIEQALGNIKQACANFNGTLAQHQAIQESIKVVETEIARAAAVTQASTGTATGTP
jgi:hypothetical protein